MFVFRESVVNSANLSEGKSSFSVKYVKPGIADLVELYRQFRNTEKHSGEEHDERAAFKRARAMRDLFLKIATDWQDVKNEAAESIQFSKERLAEIIDSNPSIYIQVINLVSSMIESLENREKNVGTSSSSV
jgi:hypothetical protein